LVVIAIIGILASIILASLNSARARGTDAATKSDLDNARAQAELFYDTGNTYTGVCTTTEAAGNGIQDIVQDASTKAGTGNVITALGTGETAAVGGNGGTTVCHVATNGSSYAAEVPLKSVTSPAQGYWCVDSTGKSEQTTNVLAGGFSACS
jgi:type II secretory pathway pseudopilin PulG